MTITLSCSYLCGGCISISSHILSMLTAAPTERETRGKISQVTSSNNSIARVSIAKEKTLLSHVHASLLKRKIVARTKSVSTINCPIFQACVLDFFFHAQSSGSCSSVKKGKIIRGPPPRYVRMHRCTH